ncbi:MAG TPA: hypothetical protein VFF60_12490 [Candidatus Binatus sp.]|nr:hypothetical protein [Candidatus Binatus sp.]
MSLELLNALAALGTFVVIAATAIAALFQLRHARNSNQIAAMTQLQEAAQTPHLEAAQNLVMTDLPARLEDPEFRYEVRYPSARTRENAEFIGKINDVGNFFENMGLLVRMGAVDRDIAVAMWASIASGTWDRMLPYTAVARRRTGDALWENFEYLVVLSRSWMGSHPHGMYPPGVPRIEVPDVWREADTRYEASRPPSA